VANLLETLALTPFFWPEGPGHLKQLRFVWQCSEKWPERCGIIYIYIHVYISLRITILLLKNVCKDTKSHTPTAVDSQPHIFWIEVVHPFDLPSIGFF